MEFKADFSAAEADRAALAEVTFLAGGAGARLGGVFACGELGRVDAFGAAAGGFGVEDFADNVAVAFLDTGSARAAVGADLAGDRVTGISSQRGYTASARNERDFCTRSMRSFRIAKRGGL
jgi:hypothetical protein